MDISQDFVDSGEFLTVRCMREEMPMVPRSALNSNWPCPRRTFLVQVPDRALCTMSWRATPLHSKRGRYYVELVCLGIRRCLNVDLCYGTTS